MVAQLKATPEREAEVRKLKAAGLGERDIAARTGLSKGTVGGILRRAAKAPLERSPASKATKSGGRAAVASSGHQAAANGIDANAPPLAIARGMLEGLTDVMASGDLEAGSSAHVRLGAEARQLTKLIAALEREEAKKETPAEAEARKRREDGIVRREILQYVEQHERMAARPDPEHGAPWGRCAHCAQALPSPGEPPT